MPNIVPPLSTTSLVDKDGNPTDEFYRWITSITRTDMLVGTGSPEGIIEAQETREYMDRTGIAGAVKYIKQLPDIGGNRKLGWVPV